MRLSTGLLAILALTTLPIIVSAQQKAGSEAEAELALSAAPEHLRAGATVFVLGDRGYVEHRKGINGFHCLVNRSRTDTHEPVCWDEEGSRAIMPVDMERAKLRREGLEAAEIDARISAGFASGRFRAPARVGVAYMLSTENRVFNGQRVVHYHPHIMVYAPYVKNSDIGSNMKNPNMPWVLEEGSPHAYIIVVTK